jgi:preprotein translocase subunit YajC
LTAFLMTMTTVLAQATAPTSAPTTQQTAPGWAQALSSPMTLVLLVGLFIIVTMSRSKKKQERERTDMLSGMKRGDRVQTIGGIIGKVVEVDGQEVLVKVDETSNTKIRFRRDAIHRVIGDEAKAEAASK